MAGLSIIGAVVKVALVFGLLYVTLRVVARLNGGRQGALRGAGRTVEVLARSPLSRGAALVVARIGERCLALGVTDHSVTVLGDVEVGSLPLAEPSWTQGPANRPAWRDLLDGLRERTVRR